MVHGGCGWDADLSPYLSWCIFLFILNSILHGNFLTCSIVAVIHNAFVSVGLNCIGPSAALLFIIPVYVSHPLAEARF